MRFGSRLPSVVLSCGSPRYYKNVVFSKGTQLAEALSFLEAHKGKVALVTIDIGANDLSRFDAQGNLISCLFEPQGCVAQAQSLQSNLSAILAELEAAAGPGVPIVGMSYYDVFAPVCASDPFPVFICARVDAVNTCSRPRMRRRVCPSPTCPARSRTTTLPARPRTSAPGPVSA
jgi:hypothetical protein